MNNSTKTTLKIVVAFLWLAFVGYSFVASHSYYQEGLGLIGRVIVMSIVFLIAIGIPIGVWMRESKIKISPWKILVTIILITASLLVVTEISADLAIYHGGTIFRDTENQESWGILPDGMDPEDNMEIILTGETLLVDSQSFIELLPAEVSSSFDKVNLLKAIWIVESNLLIGIGFILALMLVAFAIGRRILRLTKIGGGEKLEKFLLNIAVGFGVLMANMFLLGVFHVATLPVVLATIAILTAISYKDAYVFLRGLVFSKYEVNLNFKSLSFWVVLSAILVLGYNLLSIIRPIPIGWDDSSQYLYIPERFTYLHGLVGGFGSMYNWELINAIASYSSSAMLPLFTNFLGGLLAVAAIFLLLSKFVKKETALMLSAVFYILPMVIFQSSIDLKNDLACLFFIIMSVWVFLKWFNDEENAISWLGLAGVIMGIAIGVKVTAGMTLVILAVLMAKKLIGNKGAVGIALLSLGFLLHVGGAGAMFKIPAIVVEYMKYIFGAVGVILIALGSQKIKAIKPVLVFLTLMAICCAPWIANPPASEQIDLSELTSDCSVGSGGDEYVDYIAGRDAEAEVVTPLLLLKAPWQMTMNPGFNNPYVDISMIFLGLLPLFVWYFVERKNDKDFRLIFILSVFYFSMLVLFFFEVPWYGYFGFVMLLILVGRMLEVYEKEELRGEKLLSIVIKIAIGATAILVVLMRVGSFGDEKHLAYIGGILDSTGYISAINPGVLESVEVIGNEGLVYNVGGATQYFFANTDVNFIKDLTLGIYMCMREKYDGDELGAKLKELEISYISFDYTALLGDDVGTTIKERYLDLLDFGARFFETEVSKEDYVLFKVK